MNQRNGHPLFDKRRRWLGCVLFVEMIEHALTARVVGWTAAFVEMVVLVLAHVVVEVLHAELLLDLPLQGLCTAHRLQA